MCSYLCNPNSDNIDNPIYIDWNIKNEEANRLPTSTYSLFHTL